MRWEEKTFQTPIIFLCLSNKQLNKLFPENVSQNIEIQQNKKSIDILDTIKLISNDLINDYYNKNNNNYYDEVVPNIVYKSKNLLILYISFYDYDTQQCFYMLPFIEGYKLLDTYLNNNVLLPENITFIDSCGVEYTKSKIFKCKTFALFYHKIDEQIYISYKDYFNDFYYVKITILI